MKLSINTHRLFHAVALAIAWCALWRDFSVANAIGGVALGTVLTSPVLFKSKNGPIRWRPLIKLFALVAVDLIKSTLSVIFEVITPTDRTDEKLVDVRLQPGTDEHILLLVLTVTLTPGTAVVSVSEDRQQLTLHLLHGDRESQTVEHLQELARTASEALPIPAGSTK